VGNILQLSNQVSLGCSEEEISDNLSSLTRQLIDQERSTREALARDLRRQLEDRVHRAYGILTNARILGSQEAIGLLSDVKLGIDLGMLGGLDSSVFTELLILTRPAHLQKFIGRELTPEERDVCRADLVRERFRIDGLKE
jgi:protein arginine kinase